jgi:hypothetical protein
MKFKVGDKVRVRSWESMEKEFGVDECGNLKGNTGFCRQMADFCNTVHTVTKKCGGVDGNADYFLDVTDWYFDERVLEPTKQETKGNQGTKCSSCKICAPAL